MMLCLTDRYLMPAPTQICYSESNQMMDYAKNNVKGKRQRAEQRMHSAKTQQTDMSTRQTEAEGTGTTQTGQQDRQR